jgi:GDP-L-fucose synthase
MNRNSKIYIAGHTGMVGSAIHRRLVEKGYTNFVLRSLDELDLTRQQDVEAFFASERPEYVILAAAKVGGILANNTYRGQFIYENLQIQNNIIHQSYVTGVKKLLFLGSSCIYPKDCDQPIKEEYLLTGLLEQTNEPYAIAKIAGIKLCESYYRQYGCNFISVMPTNLYGPNDNYNLETSHVLPALIRKIHLGKCLENGDWAAIRDDLNKRAIEGIDGNSTEEQIENILLKYGISINNSVTRHATPVTPSSVTLWGTGTVYREFMHVDDMAAACVKIMEELDIEELVTRHATRVTSSFPVTLSPCHPVTLSPCHPVTFLNIGTGLDQTIRELALLIKKVIGFNGEIDFDPSKADGTYKKLLDISRLNALGFRPSYSLEQGIEAVYKKYAEPGVPKKHMGQ